MKSLVNLALGLVLAVTPLFIALAVANQMMLPEKNVEKLHMNEPALWTSTPTVVTDHLAYERIPGVTVPENEIQVATVNDRAAKTRAASKIRSQFKSEILAETARTDMIDTAGIEACSARYRSYRESDNTYQPYGGGARRPCTLRNDDIGSESASANNASRMGEAAVMSDAANGTDALFAHERWCQNRYSSYDPSSDTYQPFDGPRTACLSPYN